MPLGAGEPFSFDQTLTAESAVLAAGEEAHTGVVILGAGLAGLTCAYRYAQRLGRPATRNDLLVLERQATVGGRVRSIQLGDTVMELGAVSFQPAAYPRYTALVGEMGLQGRLREIPRRAMVLGVDGRAVYANPTALALDGVRSLSGRGLFTVSEEWELLRLIRYQRRITSAAHFDQLLALHDRSVAEWARQMGWSAGIRRKFVEPFIGFTFNTPERTSAAFGVLLLGSNLSAPAKLAGGLMQLPEALAARLGDVVATNALARRVERTADGFATTYMTGAAAHRVHSRALVVALPAFVAAQLLPEMRERASAVHYGNGTAVLLHGALKVPGELQVWRTDEDGEPLIYGGQAQSDGRGGHYLNLLTYRGASALSRAADLFVNGAYEQLGAYVLTPAVAAAEPNQKPLPIEWGDGLYLAGDCTGLFPSQEAAVSSGEQVAALLN